MTASQGTASHGAGAPRIRREKRTIAAMVEMYCRSAHGGTAGLCGGCTRLLDYAGERIDRCRFKDAKPACNSCPVHCYARPMRQEIIRVMRFSGPRMLVRHPVLAVLHLLDGINHRASPL